MRFASGKDDADLPAGPKGEGDAEGNNGEHDRQLAKLVTWFGRRGSIEHFGLVSLNKVDAIRPAGSELCEILHTKICRKGSQAPLGWGVGGGEAWPQKHATTWRLKLRRSEKRKGSKAVVLCDEDF
jgi:hypothetical protein